MSADQSDLSAIEFENEMAQCFNDARIKAPVHLYDGNEEQMIEVFKNNNINNKQQR